MKHLIDQHITLLAANREESRRLSDAYGWQDAPDEAPTPTFQSQRRQAEARTGSRLTKFFSGPLSAVSSQQSPSTILVATEARLLLLPEPLLAQVQACEKAFAAGRWYVVTPVALWQSLTRLLGA